MCLFLRTNILRSISAGGIQMERLTKLPLEKTKSEIHCEKPWFFTLILKTIHILLVEYLGLLTVFLVQNNVWKFVSFVFIIYFLTKFWMVIWLVVQFEYYLWYTITHLKKPSFFIMSLKKLLPESRWASTVFILAIFWLNEPLVQIVTALTSNVKKMHFWGREYGWLLLHSWRSAGREMAISWDSFWNTNKKTCMYIWDLIVAVEV